MRYVNHKIHLILILFSIQLNVIYAEQIYLYQIPEWEIEDINKTFMFIRDHRYLKFNKKLVPIPWRYVDNYCALRADLAVKLIQDKLPHLELPRKIIAYPGSNIQLRAQTDYALMGKTISMSYHVALTVRHQNQVYVLDPTINFAGPLALEEWKEKLNYQRNLPTTVISCDPYSYALPHVLDCQNPRRKEIKPVKSDVEKVIRKEKRRLKWKKLLR